MEAPGALQALPPQTNLAYDTTTYSTTQAAMSGSAEFANVDDM
jgi:hypothetical protein